MQTQITLHIDEWDDIGRGIEPSIIRLGNMSIFFPANGIKLRALRALLTAQIEEIENT